tara:strand:- start:228 stop:548 length:321 start_codon:yes stop_codon:yes gene_type:complete
MIVDNIQFASFARHLAAIFVAPRFLIQLTPFPLAFIAKGRHSAVRTHKDWGPASSNTLPQGRDCPDRLTKLTVELPAELLEPVADLTGRAGIGISRQVQPKQFHVV